MDRFPHMAATQTNLEAPFAGAELDRGLAESFTRYLVRRPKNRVGAESTTCRYLRDLSAVFNNHSGRDLEKQVRNHFFAIAKVELTPKYGLEVAPKRKDILDPSGSLMLKHTKFHQVRQ